MQVIGWEIGVTPYCKQFVFEMATKGFYSLHCFRIMPNWPWAAIDPTIFNHENGQRYFLFASWSFGALAIYIAPLPTPTLVGRSPVVELKRPTEPWECYGGCTNEGAFFLYRNSISYCVYSVSSTWDPNYALAVMSIPDHKNAMDPRNWYIPDGPVFWRNNEEDVYTTGHAAFTVSPDQCR